MVNINDLSNKDILKYAVDSGIIDIAYVQEQIEMQNRGKILKEHPYKIWQGKDEKWRTYLPDKDKGRKLAKRSSKESIEDLIYEFYSNNNQSGIPTLQEIFTQWTDEKLKYGEICVGTYDRYRADYKKFISGSSLEGVSVCDITEELLEDFIRSTISKYHLTSKCFSNIRTLLCGLFKYAKKHKYTELSITAFFGDLDISNKVFKKVIKKDEEQVFREDEWKKVIEYLNEHPTIQNLAIILQFQTGMRIGELSAIKHSDIVGNRIHIQRTEIKYRDRDTKKYIFTVKEFPKTDAGDRYIILTPSAIETVKRILRINPFGEYLIMNKGKRVRAAALNKHIYTACKNVGIPKRSSHKIRKTYGTILVDSKVDDSLIIRQMGHTDIKTTKEFYYFSNKTKQEQEEQIDRAIPF